MSTQKAYRFTVFRINEGNGHQHGELMVCPGDDNYGVRLANTDSESQEYWGTIDLTMSPDMARHLGQALIDMAGLTKDITP